ncbi:MAG: hypothetical protein HOQ28_19555, partial [Thermoleophilia bacterium]|nr:hypothetical protein [Thermoleophilia bacterium]
MTTRAGVRPEAAEVFERLDRLGLKQRDLAAHLKLEENKISKVRAGERQFRGTELLRALRFLEDVEATEIEPDLPDMPPEQDYVSVEVLPTYAGMGGGGSGEGDRETALVPRAL